MIYIGHNIGGVYRTDIFLNAKDLLKQLAQNVVLITFGILSGSLM